MVGCRRQLTQVVGDRGKNVIGGQFRQCQHDLIERILSRLPDLWQGYRRPRLAWREAGAEDRRRVLDLGQFGLLVFRNKAVDGQHVRD